MLRHRHETLNEEVLHQARAAGGSAEPPRPAPPAPPAPRRSYARDRRAGLLWEYQERVMRMPAGRLRLGRVLQRLGAGLCLGSLALRAAGAGDWTGSLGGIGVLSVSCAWFVLGRPPIRNGWLS